MLENFTNAPIEVLSKEKNYIMVKLLEGVVNQGSGGRLKWKYGLTNQIAAKTGTTQNHSDGWFIGFTPNLVTGVWTGADNRAVRFRDLHMGQGAEMALPIWANYMTSLYNDNSVSISKDMFPFPENGVHVTLDCNKVKEINNDDEF